MTQLRGRTCLVTGARGGIGAAIVAALQARGGHVDVLVNCAGAGLYGRVAELDRGDFDRIVALNLVAPIMLTRALLPGMLERGEGHILNIASLVAHVPKETEAAYAATKAGLAGFTRSLREEVHGSGVVVSLVSPAVVATRFFDERGAPYARRWPRPIAPERVAAATIGAIERNRAEVIVPRWLTIAVRIYGGAPGVYRALALAAAVATSRG